ncbi:rhomboid family intramembrane serine protease [Rhodovulum adriaticum]|uniref:Membrane associated rhomboid family serine protease n=1 Tax=Rhodovulum adriaticum TaxID=35804 RepID=A0A4R2NL70_RHOAD|nr:rhomboid family intramembrane serine protease [Rhodovulum adriaticum]MBK1635148.1 rhomboid family intramembrane serine protease [Rhodovulum adriaticum]TCP22261.1 membrane associated rhomboid family serine protease [Rhodovulum adriaticum]
MFPLRDHNPSERTPYVTYALIAVNVIVFLSYWPLFSDPPGLESFFFRWGLVPAALSAGQQPAGLVTSMFLHGGLLHLAGNMLFLWIFGDNLEDEMGHTGFALFYLASGLAAGLGQYLSAPNSLVPMVGASGAIAGVMGGYLLLFPRARVDILFIFVFIFKVIPVPAWLMLGAWFGLQVLAGSGADAAEAGVAHWAHAGGFVAGLVLTLPLWLRRGGTAYWARNHGHPPHPEIAYRRSPIPTVRRRR